MKLRRQGIRWTYSHSNLTPTLGSSWSKEVSNYKKVDCRETVFGIFFEKKTELVIGMRVKKLSSTVVIPHRASKLRDIIT